ncbi:hypothetical protein [Aliirhizobium smilacinae]|uniref:hypothetical protein n=1 Tax=Aliirhizobium smilacinae TaxID=1395944 RepID=UPI0015D5831E|nr:hypothetical protein [Rhizobium smilacinae]
MQPSPVHPFVLPAALFFGLAALVLSVVAFAGWIKYGSSILLSAGETALSWCF